MNYLAHMLLTWPHPQITTGNLIGDFVRKKHMQDLPQAIRAGVEVHRYIDTTTDNHTHFKSAVRFFRQGHGKYAPVVVDMVFDHILAMHWDRYSDIPYPQFCKKIYALILRNVPAIPVHLQPRITSMVIHHFLSGYDQASRFRKALQRLDTRAQFPSRFRYAVDEYLADRDILDRYFHSFFPDMLRETTAYLTTVLNGRPGNQWPK